MSRFLIPTSSLRMRWAVILVATVGLLVAGIWAGHQLEQAVEVQVPPPTSAAPAPAPPPVPQADRVSSLVIPPHGTFAVLAETLNLSAAPEILRAARGVYNLNRIQSGHAITVVRTASGLVREVDYQVDADRQLRMQPSAPDPSASWTATLETIPYQIVMTGISGVVQNSLFGAVDSAGETGQLALQIASVFGWDIDFYTDTRSGDIFRVIVEKRFLNGEPAGYGQVAAAEYIASGHIFDAVRYRDIQGIAAFYHPDGGAMKRAFLSSPLKYDAPISSGFSLSRFHPILKEYRAHLGTDFAAPTGTPVQSIGDGVVTRAGNYGGEGNMVQIRHANGYETHYLHLSKILVKLGQRVSQGERIGLVGMTGLATGPHLDFRIERNGEFENFEVVRRKLPLAEPVASAEMSRFLELCNRWLPELKRLDPGSAAMAIAPQPLSK